MLFKLLLQTKQNLYFVMSFQPSYF